MAFSFGSGAGSNPLFGAKPAGQPAQSGGLFGQQPPQGQQGQSGGLFGQQPQGQQGQSGGPAGQSSQPGQSGGLFGQSQGQSQPGQSQPGQPGGLFGQSQQGQSSGLFGQSQPGQSGGPFGQSQQGQSGSLFGQSQPGQSGGLFSQSTQGIQPGQSQPAGLFGQSTSAQPAGRQGTAPDQKLGAPLNTQLERIRSSWDTNNLATCQFQFYFYNRANDAASVQQLSVRRPGAVGPMHEALWNRAMQENPDPQRLYPVLAVGFGDLQARTNAQLHEAGRQRAKLAELGKQLATLQQKHDLSNSVRAQSAIVMQSRIHQRLLGLIKHCYMLLPALRGQALTGEEDRITGVLENCEAQLNGVAGEYTGPMGQHARLRARLNELWAQLGVIRAQREALRNQGRGDASSTEWAVVDPTSFQEIAGILGQQQQGLLHLSQTLTADTKVLETVCDGLAGVPLVGVRGR